MKVLRTPDTAFEGMADYPFSPHGKSHFCAAFQIRTVLRAAVKAGSSGAFRAQRVKTIAACMADTSLKRMTLKALWRVSWRLRARVDRPELQAVPRFRSLTGTGTMLGVSPFNTAMSASTSISPA